MKEILPGFLLNVKRDRTATPAQRVGLVAALAKRAGTFSLESKTLKMIAGKMYALKEVINTERGCTLMSH